MAGTKKDSFENALLLLLFNNTALANIGNAGGLPASTLAGSFFIGLFTAAPSDSAAGTEVSYTGYARVAVARSAGGWTIAGNQASNAALITFGMMTAGAGGTVTHFGICKAGTAGVDDAIYWGDGLNLAITVNIIPEFAIGALTVTED